jgi:Zn ribbon nucleic-acid-binding protein
MRQKEETKECPLCGDNMRRKDMELVDLVPGTGTSEAKKRKVSEWVCPECEFFEEIEPEGRK